jgi:ferrochelatase
MPYDAILLVSFGGPERISDVIPFLENVLKGRNVPRQRMLEVAKHYELFGGVSPINEENRKLIAALKDELKANGPDLPVYFGNRNWHPMLADTIKTMRDEGVQNALAFVTSAYSSYSSCRQYLEDIERASASVGAGAPRIEKLRAFYNHPGFIEANLANVRSAWERIPEDRRADAQLVFTAHSIPLTMARNCDYETGRLISADLGIRNWQLVFQSRSGSPGQPWLGPDVCDCLRELSGRGTVDAVVAPIGFVCDHMEVIYDLDLEARQLCEQIGLNMQRAATVGTQPAFVRMIRELISERIDPSVARRFLGDRRPADDLCKTDCCAKG